MGDFFFPPENIHTLEKHTLVALSSVLGMGWAMRYRYLYRWWPLTVLATWMWRTAVCTEPLAEVRGCSCLPCPFTSCPLSPDSSALPSHQPPLQGSPEYLLFITPHSSLSLGSSGQLKAFMEYLLCTRHSDTRTQNPESIWGTDRPAIY